MTLKTLFAIPIAVILIVTLPLAGMIAGQDWSSQERGKAAVDAVDRMRLLIALQTDLRADASPPISRLGSHTQCRRRRSSGSLMRGGKRIGELPISLPVCAPPPKAGWMQCRRNHTWFPSIPGLP